MSETTTAPAPAAGADPIDAWVRAANSDQPPQQPAQPQPEREPAPQPREQPERPPQPGEQPQPGEGEQRQEGDRKPGELTDEEREERKRIEIAARVARRAAREAEAERDRLRDELARQTQGGQETEEQRIERRAAELIAQRAHAERVNAFNVKCNEIYDLGIAAHGEAFTDAIEDLKSARVLSPALIEAADEAAGKDAHRVLAYLGEHTDEAKRLAGLPPERLGAAVAKIAARATERPAPRTRTAAPPPVRGVVGAGTARGEPDPETMPIADWIAAEEKRSAQRRGYA